MSDQPVKIDFSHLKAAMASAISSIPEQTPPVEVLAVVTVYRTPTGLRPILTAFMRPDGNPTQQRLVLIEAYTAASAEIAQDMLRNTVPPPRLVTADSN